MGKQTVTAEVDKQWWLGQLKVGDAVGVPDSGWLNQRYFIGKVVRRTKSWFFVSVDLGGLPTLRFDRLHRYRTKDGGPVTGHGVKYGEICGIIPLTKTMAESEEERISLVKSIVFDISGKRAESLEAIKEFIEKREGAFLE